MVNECSCPKIKNKTKMPITATSIQDCTGGVSLGSYARKWVGRDHLDHLERKN